jgi:hypothetical protein
MDFTKLKTAHDAQNEAYINGKGELFENGDLHRDAWAKLADKRLDELEANLSAITDEDVTAKPYVETIDCLVSLFDDVILECALVTGKRKKAETAILELCQKSLATTIDDSNRDTDNEHVICSLIDGLIINEMPLNMRSAAISAAILHDSNPLRLGQTFYDIFCNKYPSAVDQTVVAYLKCEGELRTALTNGTPGDAGERAEALMSMSINNPEKYLLMSMVMFFNAMSDDASRVLEIGLGQFPGNERLLRAKDGLAEVS